MNYYEKSDSIIQSARDLGFRGKPDSFHAAYSFKKKRFLITKNERHFLDHKAIPFHSIQGIIIIRGDMGNMADYIKTLRHVFWLMPYSEAYQKSKIVIGPNEISIRYIDNGQVKTIKFNHQGQIWED